MSGRRVKALFDSAQTTQENVHHWAWADNMSAKAANSLAVRKTLRVRSRYEVQNNSYAQGIVQTLANDTIGTGPRLQMEADDDGLNRDIEAAWNAWSKATDLGGKLWTMRHSQVTDGEAFGLFTTNPAIDGPVQLDLKPLEADQVTDPYLSPVDPYAVDGIVFDTSMNPIEYHMLRYHPGDQVQLGYIIERVPASQMVHWYRSTRPGQYRGIPDIAPALPLFAQLRRYTLAVLAAAETAADFTAVLSSEAPADAADEGEPFDLIDIERRMMMTLPAGYKLSQFKAEQPTTTYGDFKGQILREIGRCLNMPYNVVAGDSSGYNYSSGRLDHLVYHKALRIDRRHAERAILDRLFAAWLQEFSIATGLRLDAAPHRWFWDSWGHIDPATEAKAAEKLLANNLSTLAEECAKDGRDWEAVLKQRAREVELQKQLGLVAVATPPKPDAPQPQDDEPA